MFPAKTLRRNARRAASAAATTAVSAALRLILPAVCRLCDKPIAEGEDFCHTCSAGLSLSESRDEISVFPLRDATGRFGSRGSTMHRMEMMHPDGFVAEFTAAEPTVSLSERKGGPRMKVASVDPATAESQRRTSCPHCQDLDLTFDRVISRWCYQGTVCDAVVAAKYVHQLPLGDALGRRLG